MLGLQGAVSMIKGLTGSCILRVTGSGPEIVYISRKVQYVPTNCYTNGIQRWAKEGSSLYQKPMQLTAITDGRGTPRYMREGC